MYQRERQDRSVVAHFPIFQEWKCKRVRPHPLLGTGALAFLEHLLCPGWIVSRQYLARAEVNINMVYCASGPPPTGAAAAWVGFEAEASKKCYGFAIMLSNNVLAFSIETGDVRYHDTKTHFSSAAQGMITSSS